MNALGKVAGTWSALEVAKARKLLAATVVSSGGTPDASLGDRADWGDCFGKVACSAARAARENLAQGRDGAAVFAGAFGTALDLDDYFPAAPGESAVCRQGGPGSDTPSACG